MNCNVAEIFGPTIQGEGILTGTPSVFVRFNGCNLACAFANSVCDTAYTSIHPEPSKYKDTEQVLTELCAIFNAHPTLEHLVITGGEPMLQQKAVQEIIDELRMAFDDRDIHVTIETNGSCVPTIDLLNSVSLWSVSPKLENSENFTTDIPEPKRIAHKKNRFNPEALDMILSHGLEVQVKFVYDGSDEPILKWWDDLKKVTRSWIDGACYKLLMPAGRTVDELSQTAPSTIDAAIRMGYRYCDRTHIRIWGDKREV